MTKMTATKQELVNLMNGLFAVQEVQGKQFSLTVSKNIQLLKEDGGKEKIEQLEKDNKNLVDARRKQLEEVERLMKEEAKINLVILKEDMLPETITAKQINGIIKIIE